MSSTAIAKQEVLINEPHLQLVPAEVPVLQVRNLNVKSKNQHILKNINLKVPKNAITVLLGPSGCGKTTLLKIGVLRSNNELSFLENVNLTDFGVLTKDSAWSKMS